MGLDDKFEDVAGNEEYFEDVSYLWSSDIEIAESLFVVGVFFGYRKSGGIKVDFFRAFQVNLVRLTYNPFVIFDFDRSAVFRYCEEIVAND